MRQLCVHEAAEPYGTEIDVTEARVHLLHADVLFGEEVANIEPLIKPLDAAISGDAASLAVVRVRNGLESAWIGPW
jgi:hypothetical protein